MEEAESLCRNVAIIDRGEIVQNTSMRSLLQRLNNEVFVFDCSGALTAAPVIAGHAVELVDEHCFEVEVEKGQSLNQLFDQLSAQGVQVVSMRNKANRLEELFVSLINGQLDEEGAE